MSLPCAMAPMPAAIDAPAPPDEPPQVIALSHGFIVSPCSGLSVKPRIENSGVLVRPMMIAPAFFRLAVTGESPGAILSLKPTTPLELAWPSTSMLILIVTGTPCSLPSDGAVRLGTVGGAGGLDRLRTQIDHDGVERRD